MLAGVLRETIDLAFCTGMGMRDPFIGPFLRACLAGNGFEDFLENYAESYRLREESMATWKTIPSSLHGPLPPSRAPSCLLITA